MKKCILLMSFALFAANISANPAVSTLKSLAGTVRTYFEQGNAVRNALSSIIPPKETILQGNITATNSYESLVSNVACLGVLTGVYYAVESNNKDDVFTSDAPALAYVICAAILLSNIFSDVKQIF